MDQPVKQILIIRRDLKMRRGKEVSQGAHAALNAYRNLISTGTVESYGVEVRWLEQGQTKITVRVDNEEELFYLYNRALDKGLPCALIQDAGRTEFKGPTHTAVAIGPWYAEEVDEITDELKPY